MEARRFGHSHRLRLERAADHYLQACFRKRTAARASEFAQFLGITQPYLSKTVHERTSLSVRDFLRERQLARAAALLASTPLPVHDVALSSAFGTPSTFYRCFRAAYGMTPAAYRTEARQQRRPDELQEAERGPERPLRIPLGEVMKCE